MKHLKTYEMVHTYPKEGDYVIIKSEQYITKNPEFYEESKNKIFKIDSIEDDSNFFIYCKSIGYTASFPMTELKYWSDNEDELKIYLDTNKFNL